MPKFLKCKECIHFLLTPFFLFLPLGPPTPDTVLYHGHRLQLLV